MKPSYFLSQGIPWQATFRDMTLDIKNEMLAAKEESHLIPQMPRKELTKEATYMIYVILVCILFAILGSSLTVYEMLFNNKGKKKESYIISCEEDCIISTTRLERIIKSLKRQVWLEDCKSFLKCFCVIRNGKSIFNNVSSEHQFDCLQGLRFIGNAWVILLHYLMLYINFVGDAEQAKPYLVWRVSQLLFKGNFAVDLFFVISGFLNAYFLSHLYSRHNGNISWTFFYFKRFVRLTPVYLIVLGFYATLFTYSGSGMLWPTYDTNPVCRKGWWWYLFYLDNFEESTGQCMVVYWSLAAEMLFFIISPLFIISLIRWPRFGYFLVVSCLVGSCATSFVLTYQFKVIDGCSRFAFHLSDIRNFMIKAWEYFDIINRKPFTRMCSYVVGLTLGSYLYKKSTNMKATKDNKVTLLWGWIATMSFMWISVFSLPGGKEGIPINAALYNGTKFLLFSCCMAWIIYVCVTGQAENLNRCLSWKPLIYLGRLSYCAYLIHPIILIRLFLQAEKVMDFSVISAFFQYLNVCVFTYLSAFILSILFEMPVLNILDLLSKETKPKASILTDASCRKTS